MKVYQDGNGFILEVKGAMVSMSQDEIRSLSQRLDNLLSGGGTDSANGGSGERIRIRDVGPLLRMLGKEEVPGPTLKSICARTPDKLHARKIGTQWTIDKQLFLRWYAERTN